MTEECITPLRRRMIEDMTVRRFADETQRNYIRAVKTFATFLGRSPYTATAEDLRLFQLHLNETQVRPPTVNCTVTALRFFFTVTLDRANAARHLTFVHEPRKLPTPLSPGGTSRPHKPRIHGASSAGGRDIFRDHGSAWLKANAGHVSLGQLKVMSAIESCRTAALGGHVAR